MTAHGSDTQALERAVVTIHRLEGEIAQLREAIKEYGSHQSWRCDHPDRYPQDEDCPCMAVSTLRALGIDPTRYLGPAANA